MKIYYCNECKSVFSSLDELVWVEEIQSRGFCSEECCTKFYAPLMSYLKSQGEGIRKQLNLCEEVEPSEEVCNSWIEATFAEPKEKEVSKNILGETYTTFLKQMDHEGEAWFIYLICFTYQDDPSFVLFETITRSEELISHLKSHFLAPVADSSESDSETQLQEVKIDAKVLEELEQKKSQYLAEMMENRIDSDISIEQFHLYEEYVAPTLEKPDEVYERMDEGDTIKTYIRSFNREGISFFYIILCLECCPEEKSQQMALLPIISFPSLDGSLYSQYIHGSKIEGALKN